MNCWLKAEALLQFPPRPGATALGCAAAVAGGVAGAGAGALNTVGAGGGLGSRRVGAVARGVVVTTRGAGAVVSAGLGVLLNTVGGGGGLGSRRGAVAPGVVAATRGAGAVVSAGLGVLLNTVGGGGDLGSRRGAVVGLGFGVAAVATFGDAGGMEVITTGGRTVFGGADGVDPAMALGLNPHNCLRLRDTLGTQVTLPLIPARI